MIDCWTTALENFPYKLQGLGIDGVLDLTVVSSEYFNFPEVVKWCSDRQAIPVSPKECFANRSAQNGAYYSNETQFTRCGVLCTIVDGKLSAFFDDTIIQTENVAITYAVQGLETNNKQNPLVLSRSIPIVRNAVDRALADGRLISLEGRSNNGIYPSDYTHHSLEKDCDGCEYARVLTPIVGRDIAEANADVLRNTRDFSKDASSIFGPNYTMGEICLPSPSDLKPEDITDNVTVLLFSVFGLQGHYRNALGNIVGARTFDDKGHACGVASKNSSIRK